VDIDSRQGSREVFADLPASPASFGRRPMKMLVMCPECVHSSSESGVKHPQHWLTGELDDNGIVHTKCKDGHVGQVVYDAPRHAILIESAARAFLDGYTNEVVAVLSTALERAYEFYLRVVFRAKGIDAARFAKSWRELATSSERQYGAFHMIGLLFSSEIGELDRRIAETRNKVVHRGHIVREKEALEFAELVFSRIRAIERELDASYKEHVIAESEYQVEVQKKLVPKKTEVLVLKKTNVNVDKKTHKVLGVSEKFIEIVAGLHQARQRGFPE
jgi:hypothetical protein